MLLELVGDLGLHPLVGARDVAGLGEAQVDRLRDVPGAEVGGHDDHGVLEVDHAALGVGQATFLQDLQQRVEDVRVSLLDLVEEDHGERLAAHLLGELATLLVADVARRRAEEPRDGVLLAELRHVELDQRVLVTEEELGERLGQPGLTDTGGTGEDERTAGALRVLQAGTGASDGTGQGLDRLVLADDALVELVLHAQQARGLLLVDLHDRDAGRDGEHLGDELLIDLGDLVHVAGTPGLLTLGLLGDELLLLIAQTGRRLEVLAVDRGLLALAHVGDLVVVLPQVGGGCHPADAQARAGLVDQVDRLVRQEPVGDVPVGHGDRSDQRLVGDRDPVVGLVTVADALEHLDRDRDRRLRHLDRLETTLESGVLLQVFPVFIQRGRTDGLQLTASQHRLQDARRVDRALGRTGTDERVDLVDEQHDVAAGLDLLEHLLQALLEVTAVTRAGDERAQVERVDLLVLERLGNVALDDVLGQALDDRRLADAGLADEDRVVLRTPRQHLHHALDLAFATDDRVELALAGVLGQVAAELVQHEAGGRRLGRGGAGRRGGAGGACLALLALEAREQLDDLLADPVEVGAELLQHLGGDALALTDEAEQDVLGADVGVAELQRLAQGQLEHLLGTRRERDVPGRCLLALADDLLDLVAHRLERDVEGLEGLGSDAFSLVDQAEQDVLGPDVVVGEHAGLFLGQHDHPAGSVSEPLEHVRISPKNSGASPRFNPADSLRVPDNTTRSVR